MIYTFHLMEDHGTQKQKRVKANFLLSRGVIIDKKEFYSNEFQEMTNLSRAKYDGSFWSEIQQKQIYFEIWGNDKDKRSKRFN